ncbi:MAG: NADH-quinone oxidoreductase subunit C, partial [Pirellulaceae bacterium]|nr:NADH-quinone oxidoreductase subunit C [Pirellulaceae bacterium]
MSLVDDLKSQFGDHITGANLEAVDPWIEVAPAGLRDVCEHLKSEPSLQFDMCNCITGVDYLQTDEKKAKKTDWEPHT